jgi:transposase
VDRGKPGSKIHAVSDRNGLPLTVVVSAANVNDSTMFEDVLDSLRAIRQPLGRPRRWPGKLHGDKGYDYRFCRELVRRRGMIARIARKGIESSTHLGRYRYVIERCLEWVSRFRRLARRYDRKASHFIGFLRLACALICYRRAVRLELLTSNDPK